MSTPPVIIISARPSSNSLMAIFIAAKELAQAASITQFVPPRLKRFATRPEITFPMAPGNALSFQPIYASFIFSTIFWVSSLLTPLLINTFSQTGYWSLFRRGAKSLEDMPTKPRMTPVLFRISSFASM